MMPLDLSVRRDLSQSSDAYPESQIKQESHDEEYENAIHEEMDPIECKPDVGEFKIELPDTVIQEGQGSCSQPELPQQHFQYFLSFSPSQVRGYAYQQPWQYRIKASHVQKSSPYTLGQNRELRAGLAYLRGPRMTPAIGSTDRPRIEPTSTVTSRDNLPSTSASTHQPPHYSPSHMIERPQQSAPKQVDLSGSGIQCGKYGVTIFLDLKNSRFFAKTSAERDYTQFDPQKDFHMLPTHGEAKILLVFRASRYKTEVTQELSRVVFLRKFAQAFSKLPYKHIDVAQDDELPFENIERDIDTVVTDMKTVVKDYIFKDTSGKLINGGPKGKRLMMVKLKMSKYFREFFYSLINERGMSLVFIQSTIGRTISLSGKKNHSIRYLGFFGTAIKRRFITEIYKDRTTPLSISYIRKGKSSSAIYKWAKNLPSRSRCIAVLHVDQVFATYLARRSPSDPPLFIDKLLVEMRQDKPISFACHNSRNLELVYSEKIRLDPKIKVTDVEVHIKFKTPAADSRFKTRNEIINLFSFLGRSGNFANSLTIFIDDGSEPNVSVDQFQTSLEEALEVDSDPFNRLESMRIFYHNHSMDLPRFTGSEAEPDTAVPGPSGSK